MNVKSWRKMRLPRPGELGLLMALSRVTDEEDEISSCFECFDGE